MRPLTEQETKILFEKLANYTTDLKPLIAPLSDAPDADRYVFRLIKDRVYYVLLSIANRTTTFG
ncbi:putative 60S ribosome subunit biogenesis protein nip7 [Rosellinia necatrix]|uniref:Putative 60S ribosome subunit biogenesis protein nip7 n=1 Tax=Rosellinia necatrix TaxID=77044 RepID=A0A1W2TLT5_ROSNE|nr:putative 60S ribosome subunit biogenesis protein nip7 [Rosellinia necatrix]